MSFWSTSGGFTHRQVNIRAIRSVHSGHDGFLYTGLAGRTCVVIYFPPGDLFPAAPDFTKPLADPGLAPYIADAADQIGYALD